MKKTIISLIGIFLGAICFAWEPQVQIAPKIRTLPANSTKTLSVTTTTVTNIPPTNSTYRSGIIIDNPEANTAAIHIWFSTSPTAALAGLSASSLGYEILPDADPWDISIDSSLYIFVRSTGTATQNIVYTEYGSTRY